MASTMVEPAADSVPAPVVSTADKPLEKVVVHPLVLLSVVDHFNRMGKVGNARRVVGLLLGSWSSKGVLDISNSFAVPFDEDANDRDVWFLDHEYLVGWKTFCARFKRESANSFPLFHRRTCTPCSRR